MTAANEPNKEKKRLTFQKTIKVLCLIGVIVAVITGLLISIIIPNYKYSQALSYKESGNYVQAENIFNEIRWYKESEEQIIDCKYLSTIDVMNNGDYECAILLFRELGDYKESKDNIVECQYLLANKKMESGLYHDAKLGFDELNNYKDSKEKAKESYYLLASQYICKDDYINAIPLLMELKDYKNSKVKLQICIDYNNLHNGVGEYCRKYTDEYIHKQRVTISQESTITLSDTLYSKDKRDKVDGGRITGHWYLNDCPAKWNPENRTYTIENIHKVMYPDDTIYEICYEIRILSDETISVSCYSTNSIENDNLQIINGDYSLTDE